jgi:FkbM family methyltransferase
MEIKEKYGFIPHEVFAIEPDDTNMARLLRNFTPEEMMKIHPISAGLHSNDGLVGFCAIGTVSSCVSDNGDEKINVQALDFHKAYEAVSLIKMDIEGSEPYALMGARNLIQKNHPRMAICVYHNNSDLLDIYKILKEYNYKIFLRQHSKSVEETVIYAI